jgi:hypothetical protein
MPLSLLADKPLRRTQKQDVVLLQTGQLARMVR